jgi:hypothetical protein
MKIKNLACCSAAIAATLAGLHDASADFGVTLRTTTNDTVDTTATHLYQDNAFTSVSAPGTPVWLVIDRDGDGIWAGADPNLQPVNPVYDGTLAGLAAALIDPDDRIVFTGTPTAAPPSQYGRINDTSIVGTEADQVGGVGLNQAGGQVKPAYALLFDNADFSDGAAYGVNGVLTPSGAIPTLGNVILRIGENLSSAQGGIASVTVIPEPSTALLAGLGLGLIAVYRNRNRK